MPEATAERAKLTPEEQAAFAEAQKVSNQFAQRVGQAGALTVSVEQLAADDDGRVLMSVPSSFILTLDDHRQVKFEKGLANVPMKSLGHVVAEHWYVKANGCKIYTAPRKLEPLGSSTLPDPVIIGKDSIPLAQFAQAAQASTGLSTEAWNGLPEDERDEVISGIIKLRQDAAAKKSVAKPAG